MIRTLVTVAMGAALVASDPLALITGLGSLDLDDRSKLAAGRAVVTIVPSRGRDLAVVGLTRTASDPARLVEWTRETEQLYRGRYLAAMGRFSTPPRLEDLAGLTLDDEDVKDLRTCRPGDCEVKLSASEIEWIRDAPDVQLAFRQVVLARAQDYLAGGLEAAPLYEDRKKPMSPRAEFGEVAARIGLELLQGGRALAYFDTYPAPETPDVESFLYWSKEVLGGGKPIVSVTHAAIFREASVPMPYAASAGRQVWASHYLTASLSFTLIVGAESGPRYLVYVRRLRTDAFEGTFGRLVRSVVERRIRSEAPALLDGLRLKLESGAPPRLEGSY